MSGHLKAFLLILAVGVLLIFGFRFIMPMFQERLQKGTSDAADTKGTIRIGVDTWIGYFPLCSPEMERRLRQAGYLLQCRDDQADYPSRFKRLKDQELQFAVATVDSYLLNGAKAGYPGVIIAVIDESQGGDAVVARRDRLPDLNALRKRDDLRIAFTPASPSEHLLKAVSTHFDLPLFSAGGSRWRLETDGSNEALKKLQNGDADAAVLWEPDVSRALSDPAFIKLIGTGDTDKLIVDILLVERRFSKEQPEAVAALLESYYQTQSHYRKRPRELTRDIIERTSLDHQQIEPMLKGVEWASLNENGALWFGITPGGQRADVGVIEAIKAALDILIANEDFDDNPLPAQDPYRLTNRQFIADLYGTRTSATGQGDSSTQSDPLARSFAPLTEQGWRQLKSVGTLKVEPIAFRRSFGLLDYDGKLTLDNVAGKLRRYPNFRILIEGHSGLKGDSKANLQLSAARAETVARYLTVTYPIDEDRLRAVGYGSSRPLPRLPGESNRAYAYRLPRVVISLMTEAY